ncbi:hypothetical protein M426DRAFT_218264 [Hypoxylon sp. CI-4A]|nr:hypothetical protein M426DRAFT_218264 [Hypoxylon sp. CI-4A]
MLTSELAAHAADLSPATYCQLYYVLAAATVLAIGAAPESVRRLLTQYGARTDDEGKQGDNGLLVNTISWVTSIGKVPHSWFIHFYILSVSCSIFWMAQFLQHGRILEFIVKNQAPHEKTSMSINQVIIAWFLMTLQGVRRLYEYGTVIRSSSSKMWVIHWLLGISFYFCINISIWIEGASKYKHVFPSHSLLKNHRVGSIRSSDRRSLSIWATSPNTIFGIILFTGSWFMQHRCHSYLGQLKKYSLPVDGLFQYLVCPHYTCECGLYLSLALVAAPEGQLYNNTLICALLFIAANLGVTAKDTKKWYSEKFGPEKLQGRWKIIPGIF